MITKNQANRLRAKAMKVANTSVVYEKALISHAMKQETSQGVFTAKVNYEAACMGFDRYLADITDDSAQAKT